MPAPIRDDNGELEQFIDDLQSGRPVGERSVPPSTRTVRVKRDLRNAHVEEAPAAALVQPRARRGFGWLAPAFAAAVAGLALAAALDYPLQAIAVCAVVLVLSGGVVVVVRR